VVQNTLNMKNKIIILIFLAIINCKLYSQDSLYYTESLNFLQKNDFVISNLKPFLIVKTDTLCLFNSSDVISFSPNNFVDEIISYEFDSCNTNKKSLAGYLNQIPPAYLLSGKLIDNFNIYCGNVIVFFSQIVENKIYAIIKIYDEHYPPNYSYNSGYGSGNKILFLGYFDSNFKIKKHFFKFVSG